MLQLGRTSRIHHLCKATFAREEDAKLLTRGLRVEAVPVGHELDYTHLVAVLQGQALHQVVIREPYVAEEGLRVATLELVEAEDARQCAVTTIVKLIVGHQVYVVEKTVRAEPFLRAYADAEIVLLAPRIAQYGRERHAEESLRCAEVAACVLRIIEIEAEICIQI